MHRNHGDRLSAVLLALAFAIVASAAHAASFTGLSSASGPRVLNATAISADGSTVTGAVDGWGSPETFRWTRGSGLQRLMRLDGTRASALGNSVSANGSVIVGFSGFGSSGNPEAFRWTTSGGLQGIGRLPGDNISNAASVSGDGAIVVGGSGFRTVGADIVHQAFRWTELDGMQALGTLPGMAVGVPLFQPHRRALRACRSILPGSSSCFSA
ncbi:MAG: hypothetical protein R3F35_20275 [Myxococcota bacterium]